MPFIASSACGKAKMRSRPSVSSALPDTIGARRRAADACRDLGAARAAHVGQHALEHRQVGVAVGAQRDDVAGQVDAAG